MRRAVLLAFSVACVFGLVAPALALDDTKPAPACSDLAFKDPAGDQVRGFTGTPVDPAVGPNMDLIGGFFKDEAGEVTANLQISNLTNDIPTGASAISWYVIWTVGSTDYFVDATVASGAQPAYEHGTYDASLGNFSGVGPTKGKFFPGANGVIQIVIPAAAKGVEGQTLKAPYAYAYENISTPAGSLLNQDDRAPDTGNGKSYEVAQCAAGSTPPPAGATPPVTTTPPGTLPITLGSSKAKAAKAKKGKSLSLKLKSTEEVTGITATLKKGSTTYGSGKLASLNGKGTLKLKLKKALKKGTYKLQLKGSTAAGAGKATFSLKAS